MDGQRCAVRMMRRKRLSASALPAIEDRGIRIQVYKYIAKVKVTKHPNRTIV
jgi:hypothetical protein